MNRLFKFSSNEFYHLYNRGVDKRIIFTDKSYYKRFLLLLYVCNGTKAVRLDDYESKNGNLSEFTDDIRGDSLVDIVSYCLMPNHFHIIVREKNEEGISKFMQKLGTAYTMYFNKRNKRNGSLFQGTFKATHAYDDKYLKYLLSYIHLNPIKLIDASWKEKGIKNVFATEKYLNEYQYSSYLDYKDVVRSENKILNTAAYPRYFRTVAELEKEIREWITFST